MKVRVALALCAGIVLVVLAVRAVVVRSEGARAADTRHARDLEEEPLPAPARERKPEPAADARPLVLEGTVVVVDAKGEEHAAESGRIRLRSSKGREEAVLDVTVEEGRWATRVPRESGLEVLDLTLGGHRAIVEEGLFAVPPDGAVSLRAWWAKSLLLHVLADETGAALADVEVVGGDAYWEQEFLHPQGLAESIPVVAGARSPLTLPEAALRTYWVRAPGRAWGRVRIDPRSGGERTIRLVRGGAVDALLSNLIPASRAVLRLYPVDAAAPSVQALPDAGGRCAIEDLRPGSYEARAEVGPWFREPLRLAAAPVEVVAGARATVALDLADAGAGAPVPLGGTLVVPVAWGEVDPRLEIAPLRAPRDAPRPRIEWTDTRWSAGRVAPGAYLIAILPFGVQYEVEVPPAGNDAVRLVVPPPGDVVVRVVEAETGDALPVEALRWIALPRDLFGPREWIEVPAGEEPGTFRFRAPQGEIEVRIPAGDHVADPVAVRVLPGGAGCTLKAQSCCGIRVLLQEDGTTVPVDNVTVRAEPVGGQGSVVSEVNDGMTVLLRVNLPGRYRLRFGTVADYAPIPDRTVDAASGATIEVVVPLAHR